MGSFNQLKLLTGGQGKLAELHDRVMAVLDTPEKKGIRELLQRNSESCKKLVFPYIKSEKNRAAIMTALTGILEAHANECYTIGYLDSIINGNMESKAVTSNDS
jgi:hypothetical protein